MTTINAPKKVFLSYSRRCIYLAQQLYSDLLRAGLNPWIDEKGIITNSSWPSSIEQSIQQSDFFLLLWSPEADASEMVQKEYALAKQCLPSSQIKILTVGQSPIYLPPHLHDLQVIDFSTDYWLPLPKLLNELGCDAVRSPAELIDDHRDEPLKSIRDRLGNIRERSLPFNVVTADSLVKKWQLTSIPWLPSAYAMSWRMGAEGCPLDGIGDLFIILKFTASNHRDTLRDVVEYIRTQSGRSLPDFSVTPPQLLFIEGPQQEGHYEIPDDQPHQWKNCIELCHKAICSVHQTGTLHFFMEAPQGLTFPLASLLRGMNPFVVYNLNRHLNTAEKYVRVFAS